MTTTIIIIFAAAALSWAVFRKKSPSTDDLGTFQPKESSDNLSEPIISYTLYVLDTRLNKRMEMQSPKEFSNQYGILNGQTIELHWNVLNADWISINGVGFVQAIGKKEFYPTENTKYKISAKNRNYADEKEFFVRVFPVPVMEKLMVPMPEISTNNIELFKTQIPVINKLDMINFPSLQIPSVIQIQRENVVEKPTFLKFQTLEKLNKIPHFIRNDSGTSFKSKIFDRLENSFKDNYKIKDIIQTIRKHYDT